VPLAGGEMYQALETRAVDGQENPNTVILGFKFQEVQKYVSVTRHVYNPQSVLISKRKWDGMSKEEQTIIQSAAVEAAEFQRQLARSETPKALETLKQHGMTVNELPPTERDRMKAQVMPIYDRYVKDIDPDLMTELTSEIKEIRDGN
jgi:TRAP-type transport system periplasmic protein